MSTAYALARRLRGARRDLRSKWPALRTQALPWLLAFLGNLAAAGVLFALVEWINPVRALWWAVVSGTTTGYGDVLPRTVPGYAIAVYALLSSALLDRIFSAKLVAVMVEEPNLYSDAEQERDEAAAALQVDLLTLLCSAKDVDPTLSPHWATYTAALDRVADEERQKETQP